MLFKLNYRIELEYCVFFFIFNNFEHRINLLERGMLLKIGFSSFKRFYCTITHRLIKNDRFRFLFKIEHFQFRLKIEKFRFWLKTDQFQFRIKKYI